VARITRRGWELAALYKGTTGGRQAPVAHTIQQSSLTAADNDAAYTTTNLMSNAANGPLRFVYDNKEIYYDVRRVAHSSESAAV